MAYFALSLALTTSRPTKNACFHRGNRLIWVLLPVEFFDLCRLEESHVIAAAALRASGAPLPVLADAAAAAVLAQAAPLPVLTYAATAALLACATSPPVLADSDAAAMLALAALPSVLADAASPALLAPVAPPPVRTRHAPIRPRVWSRRDARLPSRSWSWLAVYPPFPW